VIASVAAAPTASSGLRFALDRAGQALGPSSLDASTDLDDVLADFRLPAPVLDGLRPPFEQLGFTFALRKLNLEANLPEPPSYTAAQRGELELALIQLPGFLFGPTTAASVLIANGIGYAFESGARLHLFAVDEDGSTEYLDTAIKGWVRRGVQAVFHPWRRISELGAAPDQVAFVKRVFEVAEADADGAAPPVVAARAELSQDEVLALHSGLLSAFPSEDALQLMLRLRTGKRLANIAEQNRLDFMVLDVIEDAETNDWLAELISGARAHNPGNAELQAAAQKISAALGGEGP
jgi:hypothetical protein